MIQAAGRVHLQDNQGGVLLFGIADASRDELLNDRANRTLDLDQVCFAALVGPCRRVINSVARTATRRDNDARIRIAVPLVAEVYKQLSGHELT